MRRPTALAATAALIAGGLAAGVGTATPASAVEPGDVAVGLTAANTLVLLDLETGAAVGDAEAITGVAAGDVLTDLDFRPNDGVLYAAALNTTTDTVSLYTILGTEAVKISTLNGPTLAADLASATTIAIDFNNVADALRLVADNGTNLRVPGAALTTGVVVTDGDINTAEPGVAPVITEVAYTNPAAGAASTVLYDIDLPGSRQFIQDPPNAGTLVNGLVLLPQIAGTGGFDIDVDGDGVLAARVGAATTDSLYRFVPGITVGTQELVPIGDTGLDLEGLAIPLDLVFAIGLTTDNQLVQLDSLRAGLVLGDPVPVTGLGGDTLVAIDTRPESGQLYALGASGQIWLINLFDVAATRVGAPLALGTGASFGFDFNPVADRIRITSDTGLNLRVNPDNAAVTVDVLLNDTGIRGSAYTNSVADATSTQLFNVDADSDRLTLQNPPNDGIQVAVGPLGVDVDATKAVAFDVDPFTDTAIALLTPVGAGNGDRLYEVDLETGAATLLGLTGPQMDGLPELVGLAFGSVDLPGFAYTLADEAGGQYDFLADPLEPELPLELNAPIVDGEGRSQGQGAFYAASDGGVFTVGNAQFYGSLGDLQINEPIVGIGTLPAGTGYSLFAADGGVFSFGGSQFYGSLGSIQLNAPIVAGSMTPTGRGYHLFAADGGVFAFGDAGFYGSQGGSPINEPVVGGVVSPDGKGYYLVAADGGVFTFGSASFSGSLGEDPINEPIVDIALDADGLGYRLAARDGGVFTFDAEFLGSAVGEIGADVTAIINRVLSLSL